ncbi:MAG: response regulator [Desulfobulbaceae bacterium]|nr:response regulator [Desulfobulbaceae bacterium]
MKLEFHILWFDDQPRGLDGPRAMIERHLTMKGFKPVIRMVTEINDIRSLLPTIEAEGNPDLIMMDWNMGIGLDGAEVSRITRRHFKYQDIIFYSAATAGELRNAVCQKGIDGVFCVHRDHLAPETKGIIDNILHRVVDVNQMRGIMMSHVSELDTLIIECLYTLHSCAGSNDQDNILSLLFKKAKAYHEDQLRKLGSNHQDQTLKKLEGMTVLDARYSVLCQLLLDHAPQNGSLDSLTGKFRKFRDEVLTPRNALAHAVEKQNSGRPMLVHKEMTYDENRLSSIRRDLIDHEDNLVCIKDSIEHCRFTPGCND